MKTRTEIAYGAFEMAMNRTGIFLISLVLVGCVAADGSTHLGVAESPFWHRTASMETKVAHFRSKCLAYGFSEGDPRLPSCIQNEMASSAADASMTMSESMNYDPPTFRRSGIVNCSTFGSRNQYTNCYY